MLELAKVTDIHPESHAVDVTIMRDGRRIPGVQVLSGSAGGAFGSSDLNEPGEGRDMIAALAWFGATPVVVGFLFPQVAQPLFAEKGRMVYRHGSDVYVTIDPNGNVEVAHPSGAFLRIGEGAEREDLGGKDYDGKWAPSRNADKAASVTVSVGAGATLTMDPAGNVSVVNVGTTTVTSEGETTLTTPKLTVNGDMVLNGKMDATGDVKAGAVSLQNHTHGGVQPGSGSSAKPN